MLRPALQEWERVVNHVRESEPGIAAFLEHAVPQRVSAERVVLSFPEGSFYGRKVDADGARAAIAGAVSALLDDRPDAEKAREPREVGIDVRFDASPDDAARTVATIESKRRSADEERRRRDAMNHPVVQDALEVFPEARGKVDVQVESD